MAAMKEKTMHTPTEKLAHSHGFGQSCKACVYDSLKTQQELHSSRAPNTQLLEALEKLSPNIRGREANGEAYWHPIHIHPYHSFTAGCPWCQRVAAIDAAKETG